MLAAFGIQLGAAKSRRAAARISVAGGVATFLLAAAMLALAISGEAPRLVESGRGWGSVWLDPLSALMATLIAAISLIVRIYSTRYMAEERGYARFFVMLECMTAALLLMATAGDLITLLIAWHLVGVALYFLLGTDTHSHSAWRYSLWTWMTHRLGDVPLALAAVLLYQAYGSWSLPDLFAAIDDNPHGMAWPGLPTVEVVGALVALAAFARSAQFLLHPWLPYSMQGPTPVSALMHAGVVNAGGFLMNRFAPVYAHTDGVLHWVFVVGLATALVGSVLMLSQGDVKKSLGYSTMGQMGFMVMECGVGAFALAMFHLIAHALFKGTMFLNAGSAIGEARRDDGVPKDDLYTFVVARQPPPARGPWLLMAVVTLALPIAVLLLSHWALADALSQKQGAMILLFFGWVTGAQLLFSTYHAGAQNPWRLVGLIVFSFIIVVVGWTALSHAFELFLYPRPGMAAALYAAAGIERLPFEALVSVVALVIVTGWVRVYYRGRRRARGAVRRGRLGPGFYALLAREFYINDCYAALGRGLLAVSARLNVWLRLG